MTAPANGPRRRDSLHALWEGFIVVLVCLNLGLIVFDSLFALGPINDLLARLLPRAHAGYTEHIHNRFALIDLAFVAVFAFDVLLGWFTALVERRYARWYYYPFAHWYDVLGCIPLSGFRWLRVLRVVVLLVRLQRLGWIDMRQWALYAFVNRYWQLALEELSDRVMVKLFSRLQTEIGSHDDLARHLIDGVVRPRKERVIKDLDRRLSDMLIRGYQSNRPAIEAYVGELIQSALARNSELRNLRRLPLGGKLADTLDDALENVALSLIQGAVEGLQGERFRALANRLTEEFFEAWLYQDEHTDYALEELLVDVLEVLKQQVVDRRWSRFVGPPAPPVQS